MATAKLVVKEEIAKLKLKQLEERTRRKQQRQCRRTEEEQFNIELLKA